MSVGLEVANEPETRRDCSNRITLLSSRIDARVYRRAFLDNYCNQYTTGDVEMAMKDASIGFVIGMSVGIAMGYLTYLSLWLGV